MNFMKKKKSLLLWTLCSSFVASSAWAKLSDDFTSGYLSNQRYDLNNGLDSFQSSRLVYSDPDAPEKVFDLNLSFGTRGSNVQDENVKATTSGTFIGVDFTWNVTKWIYAQFSGGFNFASGNSAVLYGHETSPYTGPAFDEASFTFKPASSVDISAGVVGTDFNPISSTFSGDGFAGLRETWSWESGAFIGSLKGYQVAPNNSGAANRALNEEKNPFLSVANLNMGFKYDRFKTLFGYTRFDFSGLTSNSATSSMYLGNTVEGGAGDNIVNYLYNYRGQEIAAKAEVLFRLDDKLGASGNLTQNDDAPAQRNKGWMGKTYYEYNFGRYSIKPSVTRFRFEPDVIPAIFGQGALGYLNRDGYMGEIRGSLKKYNLEAFVRYLDAKTIETNSVQSDRTSVTLGMEVKYEIL